jgi:hypothetical protein
MKKPWRMDLRLVLLVQGLSFFFATTTVNGRGAATSTGTELVCPINDYVLQDFDTGKRSVKSPDHMKSVVLGKDYSLEVLSRANDIGIIKLRDMDSNLSVIWASNSQKFAVTYSNSGSEGTYLAHVYDVQDRQIAEIPDIFHMASDDFENKYHCNARGNNLFALGWTADSANVFIVTQVFDTSDCAPMWGITAGYLIDANGNIIRRYGDSGARSIQASCVKSGHAVLPDAGEHSRDAQSARSRAQFVGG